MGPVIQASGRLWSGRCLAEVVVVVVVVVVVAALEKVIDMRERERERGMQ